MIKASDIADAISSMDTAVSFIMQVEKITPAIRHVGNRLIASRMRLEQSLDGVKIEIENDLKRKGDFQ